MTSGRAGDPPFTRIGVVGLGLLGGSIALATREIWPSARLVACDRCADTTSTAVVDEVVSGLDDLASCDLVVLAVPLDQMAACLDAIGRSGTRAVVTDVGSTKRRVMAAAAAGGIQSFIGGHPMAGGERPGLAFARADLFRGKPWLLVPGSADAEASACLERFISGLGAIVRWMDAESHDRTVAYVSHLPQIVAAALMNAAEAGVGSAGQTAAGNAFGEMTRLASSPADMWARVLEENADFVREALEQFARELPSAAADGKPDEWAREALARSARARARWKGEDAGRS